jgi:hypothetical protein
VGVVAAGEAAAVGAEAEAVGEVAAGSAVEAECPAVEAPADHGNDASAIAESHR